MSIHDAERPLPSPTPALQSGTDAAADEIAAESTLPLSEVPCDKTTEPPTRIEQCPNDATVLRWDGNSLYCVVCGYSRSERQATRSPELADYIERLRRNEGGADAKGLVELAQRLGLRWGRPALRPGRSLKLNRLDGPVLAVQEATGSDKYLVVLCGEASWSTGLVQFFKVEDGKGPSPTRVRLGREAVAQIIGGESLQCLNPGELKVVARKPKAKPKSSTPSPAPPSIAPPGVAPTPNPDRQVDVERKKKTIQAFVDYLPPLTEVLAFLLILGIWGAYLFWPWIKDIQTARALAPSDEDYRIDCFILRDASKSPKTEDYDHAEQQILDYLNVGYGDRISYSLFGTDVLPNPIPLPSSDSGSIEDQRQVAGSDKQIYRTTDFAFLFNQLSKTIKNDREAQAAARRKEHVDVVIILSDGIPDLSTRKIGCPVPGQKFISQEVITAFNMLVDNNNYATKERIYVRLVLIGGEFKRCTSDIGGEWVRALGTDSLEVISYSEIGTGALGDKLLKPLKRHSHIALKLHSLEEAERQLLDQGKRFSVAYSARSVGEGGTLRILSGTLVDDQQREMELNALINRTIKSTNPEHFKIISVPSPDDGEALGKTIRSDGEFIYLEPDASENSADFLSEQSTYTLNLKVAVESHPNIKRLTPIVDPDPPTLRIKPCNQAEKKRRGRSRLQPLFRGAIVISVIFWIGSLVWYKTAGASEGTILGQLNSVLTRVVILPYKRWFEALIILLILMTLGLFFLEEPLLLMVCVIIIFSSVLFLLSPFRESPTAHMLVRLAEFVALPLIAEGAAHYIFK